MSATLFETLRAGSGPLWLQAQAHPFVEALGGGSLARERFIHFLQQDYVFLIAYSRAVAIASSRCPELPLLQQFASLLHETLGCEMQLHRDYCAAFGISEPELQASVASPVCQAYCDFCIASAAVGGPLELLAAIAPCAVGYSQIGLRLAAAVAADQTRWPGGLTQHPYGQWISTYASEDFGRFADWLIGVVNELGALQGLPASAGAQLQLRLQQHFDLGCRYEWLFWEMAWTQQDWPL